jgi:NIPSNAP
MLKRRLSVLCGAFALLAIGFAAGSFHRDSVLLAQSKNRVFELRTYTAPEGKLDNLHARFRDHTTRIFQNHNMTNIGYWTPQDAPLSQNTLIYIIAHPSRDAAKASWAAFRDDPEWKKVASESEANGKIVAKVESVFLNATDYSPIK